MISTTQAVTTTAVLITPEVPEGNGHIPSEIWVSTDADIFLGGEDSQDFPLTADTSPLALNISQLTGPLYARAATTANVAVLRGF